MPDVHVIISKAHFLQIAEMPKNIHNNNNFYFLFNQFIINIIIYI